MNKKINITTTLFYILCNRNLYYNAQGKWWKYGARKEKLNIFNKKCFKCNKIKDKILS